MEPSWIVAPVADQSREIAAATVRLNWPAAEKDFVVVAMGVEVISFPSILRQFVVVADIIFVVETKVGPVGSRNDRRSSCPQVRNRRGRGRRV